MTLAAEILARIPAYGCSVKELRSRFPGEQPQAIDAALVGLRATEQIRLIGGMVSRPCMQAIPDEPLGRTRVPIEIERARKRLRARAWKRANPERAAENQRRFLAKRLEMRQIEEGCA